VRFVFSALTPIFNEKQLASETSTGSQIVWISVPAATELHDNALRQKVVDNLPELEKRMAKSEFDRAVGLLIALASGHWSTLDALVKIAQPPASPDWLKTVYLENVRDALVGADVPVAKNADMVLASYRELIGRALLGHKVEPFSSIGGHTLVSLAFKRVVLNTITAKSELFNAVVPLLSLLEIRRWCLSNPSDKLSLAVLGVLQSAGNEPSDPESTIAAKNTGEAFERVTAHFINAKLIAWREYDTKAATRLLTALKDSDALFQGHKVVFGDTNLRMVRPASSPRVLEIVGSGGFHAKKTPPIREEKEATETYQHRRTEWFQEATTTALSFEGGSTVGKLRNGDMLVPGSKNQPHSDLVLITELENAENKQDNKKKSNTKQKKDVQRSSLNFIQNKYSDGNASTTLSVKTVTDGLDKLLLERGVLFELAHPVAIGKGKKQNQITQLNVREEDVVYTFCLLRQLPAKQEEFFAKVARYALDVGFKGTLAIALGRKGGGVFYGDTFRHLALVHSSAPNGDD
jgi:hypothetical protein